jgi:hypothetical protein
MGWRCVWVRRQVALYVGEDLTDEEKRSVESHLRVCIPCRDHMKSLQRSRQVMVSCRSSSSEGEEAASIWPTLKSSLRHRRPQHTGSNWLPVGAMMAACLAIGVVVWNRPAAIEPVTLSSGPFYSSRDLQPTWASHLASPVFQTRSDLDDWSERFLTTDAQFHLESAVPAAVSAGEF